MRRLCWLALVAGAALGIRVFASGGPVAAASAPAPASLRSDSTELAKLPQGAAGMIEGLLSPDGSRWAAVVLGLRDAKKPPLSENMVATVLVDGQAGPSCNRVSDLSFSRDGKHVLYRAFTDVAGKPSTSALILDGSPVGHYDAIESEPAFRADGTLAPFLARTGQRYEVVVDGKVVQEYPDALKGLTLSPDGRRMMYIVSRVIRGEGGMPALKSTVVLDGKEDAGHYDKILYAMFSPDSKRTVWAVEDDEKFLVVVDGKIESKDADKLTPVRFSADGARVGYGIGVRTSSRLWKCSILVDGQLTASLLLIGNLQFAPDGKAWWPGAFWEASASGSDEVMFGVFCENRKMYTSDQFQVVNIDFTPDGKHVVYEALPKNPDKSKPDSRAYILDGKPGPVYEKVSYPVLSSDSAHWAYGAAAGGGWFVVLDGQPQAPFESVEKISFSPDGAHLEYQAKSHGRPVWVLDGDPVAGYDQISRPQFLAGGKIECLGVKARVLYRVRLTAS